MKNKILITLIILTICLGYLFINIFPSQAIKIRTLFFTKSFSNSIYNNPIHNKILIDNLDVLSKYKNYKKKLNLSNSLLPNKYKSNEEIEKIIAIANITDTVYNGIYSAGGKFNNLLDLENHLLNPNRGGRCSDYSEYFLSQLILNGFVAREVSNLNHTAIEVYATSLNKWIWVDSQFDVLVLDQKNNILNALEIAHLKEESLVFFPFNKKLPRFYKNFPECYTYDKPFKQIVFSVDSRIFTFDLTRKYFPNRKIHSIFNTIFFEKNKMIYNEH